MLDTYNDHNPCHPANTSEIEVELSELEQLQEDYFELCQKYRKRTETIRFLLDVMKDSENQLVINKLKSML